MILKKIHFIGILFICICSILACNNTDRELLKEAQKVMKQQPDSALLLLSMIDFPEKMRDKDYAQYAVSLIKAHERNKITIRRDTSIHFAIRYYRSQYDSIHLANAYLLAGRVYEEMDSLKQAEIYYTDALNLSVQSGMDRLAGKSSTELGDLYVNTNKYEKAIRIYKQAYDFYSHANSNFHKSNSLRNIGDCYVLLQRLDSAYLIYQQALDSVSANKVELIADLYKNRAFCLYKSQRYKEAIEDMKKSIQIAPNARLYPIQYFILAKLYDERNLQDSSIYFTSKALDFAEHEQNWNMLHDIYNFLNNYELRKGKTGKAVENYILYKTISDSLYQKQKFQSDIQLEKLYDYQKIKSSRQYATIIYQRFLIFSLLIIVTLFTVSALLIFRKSRIIWKKEKLLQRKNNELQNKNEIIVTYKIAADKRMELYRKIVSLTLSTAWKRDYSTFLETYNRLILNQTGPFLFEVDYLTQLINQVYNNWYNKLQQKYTELTQKEKESLLLQKGGFEMSEISELLKLSIHTLYKRNSEIRKKINIPESENIITYIDGTIDM